VVYSARLGSLNRRITYLHFTLKIVGISALIVALFKDFAHATIYAPAIVALATSHKFLK
jgi:hypothetical protein